MNEELDPVANAIEVTRAVYGVATTLWAHRKQVIEPTRRAWNWTARQLSDLWLVKKTVEVFKPLPRWFVAAWAAFAVNGMAIIVWDYLAYPQEAPEALSLYHQTVVLALVIGFGWYGGKAAVARCVRRLRFRVK